MNRYLPMLAGKADKPFDDPDWVFEVKWDGIRAIAYVNCDISFRSRNDKELLDKFPELVELGELTSKVVLDGEIIVMSKGRVDFQAVVRRNMASQNKEIEHLRVEYPASYVIFDILEKEGESLIDLPLLERRSILENCVKEGKHMIINLQVTGTGMDFYKSTIMRNLEGIIAKQKDSRYVPGARSDQWLKIKKLETCDCVVFGYTQGKGSRKNTFGALLLGLYTEDKPVYVGRVGTGFTDNQLLEIRELMDPLRVDEPWFTEADIPSGSTWIEPQIVVTVGYSQVTQDFRLRSPRFRGLRTDKQPELCNVSQIIPQTLEQYYSRRDFSATPEPSGGYEKGSGNSFVVQEHRSRRLHYDLRIERDGTYKSWAIPKGIPTSPGIRRLAIQTEDHPIEYGKFEGTIPKGEYGAGIVQIWDKGFYVPVKWEEEKIELVFAGVRVKGKYELIRFRKAGDKEWLIFQKSK